MFETLLDELDTLRTECGSLTVLHYGDFEVTQLRALADRYPAISDVRDRVTRLIGECINIYRVLRSTRVLPVTSYSLKEVAPVLVRLTSGKYGRDWSGPRTMDEFLPYLSNAGYGRDEQVASARAIGSAARRWRVSVEELLAPSAGNSVAWYREYLQQRLPVWRLLLSAYNADDLYAARAVAEWLFDEHRDATEARLSSARRKQAVGR